jgi:hypothetical protein
MKREWNPSPRDAMSLAAFRWFANTIENFAIELYATDRDSFPEIERVLRGTLTELKATRVRFAVPEEENGCPDGWVLCDGVCAPACDFLAAESSAKTKGQSPAKGPKRSKKR